jgi:hypothetical protein
MKIIGKYWKLFLLRGLVAMGFGPIILAIIYSILELTNVTDVVTVREMTVGVLTIAALAFLCGAVTQVFQIEELPLSKAITFHGIILYIAYVIVYLTNGWLKDGLVSFIGFTVIFAVIYALIWLFIYIFTKRSTDKLTKKMRQN